MTDGSAIFIVTSKVDPHADAVISKLAASGELVFRLNTEDLLNRYWLSGSVGPDWGLGVDFRDELGRTVRFPTGVKSAYHRKPDPVLPHRELADAGASDFVCKEGDEFVRSLAAFQGVRWVNNPIRIRAAQHKLPQLEAARRLGLSVPRSIVTNDPAQARAFCEACGWAVICKTLATSVVLIDGEARHVYTAAPARKEVEEKNQSIRFGVHFLQEYVPKAFELRITIIGRQVFACKIDSQSLDESKIDWRLVDPFTLHHEEYDLPEEVSNKLLALLDNFGLSFGAIDMIVTTSGKYVFVENNPNGQWYWIELKTGMPMAQAMADHLIDR